MNMLNVKQMNGAKSKLVLEYMSVKSQMAKLDEKRKQLKAQIEDHMIERKTDILWSNGMYVEQTESPSVTVNPEKFKRLVSDETFLASVGVPVANAKKVLSESELKRITVVKSNTKLITGIIE